jgi:hypothetical protein
MSQCTPSTIIIIFLKYMICIHGGALFSHEKEWKSVVGRKMDGTGDHHIAWHESSSKSQIAYVFIHRQIPDLK